MPRSSPRFPGFPPAALSFFSQLEKNNRKEWFEKKKELYDEQVKTPMIALVEALGQEMLRFAPDYIPEPKKAVFRIYRDVRFSKDKTPYKTNIAASLWRQSLGKNDGASFYVSLDHKELLVAGGVYMPSPEHLKILRLHIAERYETLRKILANRKRIQLAGELQGDSATRLPKGFLPGHPAEDLLKRKMYIQWVTLDPKLALRPEVLAELSKRMAAMTPLVEFLNEPMLGRARKTRLEFPPM